MSGYVSLSWVLILLLTSKSAAIDLSIDTISSWEIMGKKFEDIY